MAVLRLTSKKTLPLLLEALRRLQFTQTELAQTLDISIGRVNKVITWLKEKDIIIKENAKYIITQPNKLADLIAAQQTITKARTYNVHIDKEQFFKENKMFCLQSQINQEDTIHLLNSKENQEQLNQLPRGEQHIILYDYDTITENIDTVRTIIDLKSVGETTIAEELALQTWRTRQ